MSSIEGGNGSSGFASGAISSLISSGVIKLGEVNFGGKALKASGYGKFLRTDVVKAMTIASGGLSGGLSSWIAGGKF